MPIVRAGRLRGARAGLLVDVQLARSKCLSPKWWISWCSRRFRAAEMSADAYRWKDSIIDKFENYKKI